VVLGLPSASSAIVLAPATVRFFVLGKGFSAGWPVALEFLPEGLETRIFLFTVEILRSSSKISVDYQWIQS
jgi:hypothetical protein